MLQSQELKMDIILPCAASISWKMKSTPKKLQARPAINMVLYYQSLSLVVNVEIIVHN